MPPKQAVTSSSRDTDTGHLCESEVKWEMKKKRLQRSVGGGGSGCGGGGDGSLPRRKAADVKTAREDEKRVDEKLTKE